MTGYGMRAAAVLSAAFLLAACGGKEAQKAPPARLAVPGVEAITVTAVPRETFVEAVGTVRATRIAAVAPMAMGRLTSVPVSEGSRVAAGAVMATIDDGPARAQLAAAEGAVAEAEGAREEADRAIAQADAARELAERTHERYRKLLEEKVVTPQEYEEVALKRTVAAKDHERALRKAAQIDGRVAQAKGAADAARVQLGYTKVTAPFSGVVLEKRADAGSTAVPGVPLFLLEDPSRHRIEAPVSEEYLSTLKRGSSVRVTLDDAADRELRVPVTEVVPAVDPATRTFVVKAELPAGKARTGQSGRLRFGAGKGTVLAVPKRAVVRSAGSEGAFVIGNDNVVRLAVIATGAEFGDRVEVLSGLAEGARVAVSPLDRLFDGAVAGAGK
ncbi:MAG: efflux RND transporter periplasmic adaptor subunit [Thermodesulfobacteriota bacterium]